MHRKTRRPAHCVPGSMTDARDLGERLRLSRERLAASEIGNSGMAWRLWAACVAATFGYAREADQIYMKTLARLADVHRSKAAPLLAQFDELGVFVWNAAPRGSHGISELALPHVPPTVHERPSSCTAHGSLQSNEVETCGHSFVGSLEDGTSEDQGAETGGERGGPRRTAPARCALHDEDLIEGRCVPCDMAESKRQWLAWRAKEADPDADLSPGVRRLFGLDIKDPVGDERTGDGIGDDERSQMLWRGANPTKARARRREEQRRSEG